MISRRPVDDLLTILDDFWKTIPSQSVRRSPQADRPPPRLALETVEEGQGGGGRRNNGNDDDDDVDEEDDDDDD